MNKIYTFLYQYFPPNGNRNTLLLEDACLHFIQEKLKT